MSSIGDVAQLGQVSPRMLRHNDELDLPQVQVASPTHEGPIERVQPAYAASLRWIEAAGYRLAGGSRELYHDYSPADPEAGITELQLPITR